MALISGNLTVTGFLQANALLFKEVLDEASLVRGANINLINGRMYYSIDENNVFEFLNSTEVSTGSTSETSSATGLAPTYDILNLVNVTFFSLNDNTNSVFVNLNFDVSSDIVKAVQTFDKIASSIYKNGIMKKLEYQASPIISYSQYTNSEIIDKFATIKFDNSAANPVDQTSVDDMYFSDLVEWSASDVSDTLDFLLIDNTSDTTLSVDASSVLQNKFFTLNWLNYKLDLMDRRSFVSEFHKKIFNNESILYFIQNYVTLYKQAGVSRLKMYFFDYRFLVYQNMFHLTEYIKNVWENVGDYSNTLSQNILTYMADHTDITAWTQDYTSFEQKFDGDELVKAIFDSDEVFDDKIDWTDLGIKINVLKWNLASLNNQAFNDLDLTTLEEINYYGNGEITFPMSKMNFSNGEMWIPLFEIDFPLDSYFYFMM